MRRSWSVILALAAGCGRIGFDQVGGAFDASRDGAGDAASDATGDALIDGPMLGPFGVPSVVFDVGAIEDDDPTLTGDQLELYFQSGQPGGMGQGTIWMMSRAAITDSWSTPVLPAVPQLDTVDDEITPEITVDGLTLYFSHAPTANGQHDIWVTSRATRTSPWSVPQPVPSLSVPGLNEQSAAPSEDHLSLVLGIAFQLAITTRAATSDPWPAPMPIPDLDGPAEETQAWLGPSAVYFTRCCTSGNDLWFALRTGPTSFAPPQPLVELNTGAAETDPWVSPDLRTIYFTRDDAIYKAIR